MAIHQNKRFCGGRKVGQAPRGHLVAEPPFQARNGLLQERNVFPQARIVPKKK